MNDAELNTILEDLHVALKGMEVRYIPSLGAVNGQTADGYRQRIAKLRDLGMEPMELGGLLEEDANKFKSAAIV